MAEALQAGFTCECGKRCDYPAYVFAHYDEVLIFTCECKRKFNIFKGIAKPEKEN